MERNVTERLFLAVERGNFVPVVLVLFASQRQFTCQEIAFCAFLEAFY